MISVLHPSSRSEPPFIYVYASPPCRISVAIVIGTPWARRLITTTVATTEMAACTTTVPAPGHGHILRIAGVVRQLVLSPLRVTDLSLWRVLLLML